MTDQELNIKIAEHFKICTAGPEYWVQTQEWVEHNVHEEWECQRCGATSQMPRHWFPDYCNDLNEIHEAEATMDEAQRRTYFYHLFGSQRLDDGDLWKAVHATARQRAEAFYRVINTNTKES